MRRSPFQETQRRMIDIVQISKTQAKKDNSKKG